MLATDLWLGESSSGCLTDDIIVPLLLADHHALLVAGHVLADAALRLRQGGGVTRELAAAVAAHLEDESVCETEWGVCGFCQQLHKAGVMLVYVRGLEMVYFTQKPQFRGKNTSVSLRRGNLPNRFLLH